MNRVIACNGLDEAIDHYTEHLGYRLDMIVPADAPREALVSKNGESLRLVRNARRTTLNAQWQKGRAGMEYRDLIPSRLGGNVIASHIRILNGGEVADYVHYHKILFQMIYCLKGSIKVVYEDQGDPFWLRPGDCVLQPPEIRHRVLEAKAGSEVIEVSSPAEHETWIDHDLTLPTSKMQPDRNFNGQRFVRHIAAVADWKTADIDVLEYRDTGISAATNGLADVRILRAVTDGNFPSTQRGLVFYFVLNGRLKARVGGDQELEFTSGNSFVVPAGVKCDSQVTRKSEIVCVSFGKY